MKQCLNCEAELTGAYCQHCGQKASTHRYSMKSLLMHDFIHSLWHVDKSILRSWWRVLIAPGGEAQRNIAGKRAGQFPVLTLAIFATIFLLLVIGMNTPDDHMVVKLGVFDFSEWVRHNGKWIWLSMIVFYSACNWVFFRRPRYNFSEHIVLGTYNYVAIITATTVAVLLDRISPVSWSWTTWSITLLFLIFWVVGSWQSFHTFYTLTGWLWRFLSAFISFWLLLLGIVLLLAAAVNKGESDIRFQMDYGIRAKDSSSSGVQVNID